MRWRWSRAARSACTRPGAPRCTRRTRRRPRRATCSPRCSAPSRPSSALVNGDIGGGFGMKTGLTPEDALVCYAARKLGRPVKWRAERSEEFLAAHMARDQHYTAALALDREGRILALRMEMLANIGAVPVGSSAMIPLAMVAKVATSAYRVPVVDYRVKGVLTNTMATGAYRGAGRPEGNYLIERLIEKAAREMGIDRVELRRRNLLTPDELPYKTHVGETYDSGDFARMLDGALAGSGLGRFPREKKAVRGARQAARPRPCGLPGMDRRVTHRDGGHRDRRRRHGDGVLRHAGDGAGAGDDVYAAGHRGFWSSILEKSRSSRATPTAPTASAASARARRSSAAPRWSRPGRKMIRQCKESAAEALEAAPADIELRDGRFRIAGTDRSLGLGELAARQPSRVIRVSATETPSTPSWPNGAQVARGGDRCRDRRGDARCAHQLRRHRPHHQPRHRRGPDPRRHGAGRRPGAVGAGALRRRRAASW